MDILNGGNTERVRDSTSANIPESSVLSQRSELVCTEGVLRIEALSKVRGKKHG